jgi:CTP:molybdopterin cytidylyltransferase MocA
MGSPKALLAWRGTTLLAYAVGELRQAGAPQVVVVLGLQHAEIEAAVTELAGATIVLNLDEASGRSGSIRIGATAVTDTATSVIIQSVDQPCSAELLVQLFAAQADIAAPSRDGRRGHPLCFDGRLLGELRTVTEADQGLRAVVRRHEVLDVPVTTDTVFWNLNDPQAYAEALAGGSALNDQPR